MYPCSPQIKKAIDGVIYPSTERTQKALSNGAWVPTTVGDSLRSTALRYPDRPAFISDERSLNFRELDEDTERLAAALLALGLNVGDRAIFQLGTTIETAVVLLACYKAGIVPVCSLPQHREVEIGQLTAQSGARGYFVQADFSSFDLVAFAQKMQADHPELQHVVVVRGDTCSASEKPGLSNIDALIAGMSLIEAHKRLHDLPLGSQDVLSFQLSGGTTGVPKIIPRFHAEYQGHSAAWMRCYGIDDASRVIWSLPLVHNAGQLYTLIPAALMGVSVVLMPKVDIARMLELIETHRVTHALSIGPIAPQLMAYTDIAKHDLSSLKLFATMSRADSLEANIKVPCSNLYGITEGLLLGTSALAPNFARHNTQGTSGCPNDELILLEPETELPVKAGQMGEMCFRGPSSLTGFFNAPEANAKAFTSQGFYRTGDMMTAHAVDGITYYAFEGRLRDNINRGGEKIGCEEVEAFVSQYPAVADAKLVAMPDPFYGEKACVFIITRPGMTSPTVKELATFLSSKGLAKYKCPERIELVDAYPLTKVGKLDKPALKRQIVELLTAESEASVTKSSSAKKKAL